LGHSLAARARGLPLREKYRLLNVKQVERIWRRERVKASDTA